MSPEELKRRTMMHRLVTQNAAMIAMLERNHGIPPTETAGTFAAVAWTTLASHLGDKIARDVWDTIADVNRQPTFIMDLNVVEGHHIIDRH